MDYSSIGKRVKQRRKELNLTQTQIKAETGISSGNLSDIENGIKLPSTPTLLSLSQILNCSIDWILKGDYPKRENLSFENYKEEYLINTFRLLPEPEREELILIAKIKKAKTTGEGLLTFKAEI